MTNPSKPRSPRSRSVTTAGENAAGRSGSIREYTAVETMTSSAPASMPERNTSICSSSVVVTSSTTSAVLSVSAVTRPRPGKCLIATATPASRRPAENAFACVVTDSGVVP